jgi:glucose-1-phosphate thymidylyltransferase
MGIRLTYAEQPRPRGFAEAFIIGADFIGSDRVAMVLGDNIFFGHGLPELLARAATSQRGATVFAYHVRDPERYGVVTFDENDRPVSIEEKLTRPSSNWAITGLYFFDNDVVRYASEVRPSAREELEITDLQTRYLSAGTLQVERMGRGFARLDMGTFESLIDAASFVQTLETRQGMKVARLEEIAFRLGFIDRGQVMVLAKSLDKSGYRNYLIDVIGSA